ncbi:MAG: hypothetical protein WC080_02985 [Patescibacteria group bacterium]|jgi:hypothetical protein
MVYLQKIARVVLATFVTLVLIVVAMPNAYAASSDVKTRIHSHCHRDGCDIQMKTNLENLIVIDTNAVFFQDQGLMRKHHHFQDFLPAQVYARELIVIDRDAPGNTFTFKNDLTGPNSVNINKATVYVSDAIFTQVTKKIYSNQNVSVNVNTGSNTILFNNSTGNINTGDVSISLK